MLEEVKSKSATALQIVLDKRESLKDCQKHENHRTASCGRITLLNGFTQMRIFSYMLIGLGVWLLASAGYDDFRGSTRSVPGRYNGYAHYTITKQARAEEFHDMMAYHWFYASMVAIVGIIANLIVKGEDRADPMAPDSDESIDEELRKDELDELKQENDHHPKL